MNLFESLQTLHESEAISVDDLFEDIVDGIHETFGCDIDDTYYDIDNYPEEFKSQFTIYNVDVATCVKIEKMIKEKLSEYDVININYYEDSDYHDDIIKTSFVYEIKAFNNYDFI